MVAADVDVQKSAKKAADNAPRTQRRNDTECTNDEFFILFLPFCVKLD